MLSIAGSVAGWLYYGEGAFWRVIPATPSQPLLGTLWAPVAYQGSCSSVATLPVTALREWPSIRAGDAT